MPTVTSNLVLRLKDELTPAAKKASQALQGIQKAEGDLQRQAEKLAKATESLGNLQKLNKSLATTTTEFGKQRQTLKELGQQILSTDGPTKKLQESFKRTEQVMEQTRKKMEQQQKAVATMSRSFQEASGQPFRSFHSAEQQMHKDIEATTRAIGAQAKASKGLIESEERVARRRKRISNAFSGVGALAGPVILHGADEAYKAGAELQHTRVELTKKGMGPLLPGIEAQSLDLALKSKNVTQVEAMDLAADLRSVLTKTDEIARVLPAIVQAKSVLDASDPTGERSRGLGLLVKGSEVLGAGQDPERLIKLVDGFVKAMQVMGKTINPEEVYDFAKNSRLSGAQFSDRFLLTTAMSTLQELGGASSGKAANEAVGQLSAAGLGKRTGAVKLLTDIGLIKKGDVVYNNTGEVSRARKGVLHPVQGDNLLATDPDKFLYDVLLPAMEKHGIAKVDDQIAAIRQIFSGSKGAQDLFGKLITQRESYAAHAGMYPQASGIAGAAQNKNDPLAAASEVSKSLETFMGVLTSPMMLPAAHGMDALATGISKITEAYASFAKEHPDLAMAAGTAGLAGTAATGLKLTYNLFDKVFGDGGLKGAAAVQMEAGTTLMTAATQLELAAGRLGVGGAAATVAGEAEKVAGGAGAAAGTGLFGKLGGVGTAALAFGAGISMGLMPDTLPEDKFLKSQGLRFSREDEDRTNRARSFDADPSLWERIFGPATKAVTSKVMNSTMPADAAERMRERNNLIEEENQKTKDAVWQFGQLDTAVLSLKASFDGLSGTIGSLGDGSGGGLINASFGGDGAGMLRGFDLSGGAATGEHADFIRKTALRLGIDPRVAVAVAKSEGLGAFVGDRGTSFGDFQMHFGGSGIRGQNAGGLGDVFNRTHPGIDARDPKNWRTVDAWALGYAKKHGWADWHGAARIGVRGFHGIGRGNPEEAMPQKQKSTGRAIEARAAPAYSPRIKVQVASAEGMNHRQLGDRIAEKLHEHYENFVGASYADTGFA